MKCKIAGYFKKNDDYLKMYQWDNQIISMNEYIWKCSILITKNEEIQMKCKNEC